MNIYLVQRGEFKDIDIDKINGIDDLVGFQYMGSSEYEWGALPKSLKRIVQMFKDKNFEFSEIKILDKYFYLGINKKTVFDNIEDIVNAMTSSAKQNYKKRFKEQPYMSKYFEGKKIEQIKHGCKNKKEIVRNYNYCDFWWDIENDWFLFPVETLNLEKVKKALESLIKRKFYK